jgi:hypothetical protein
LTVKNLFAPYPTTKQARITRISREICRGMAFPLLGAIRSISSCA